MARIYEQANYYFDNGIITYVDPTTVWVEIGSDRSEGSTLNLLTRAKKFNIKLHTVDISDSCSRRLCDDDLTCHVCPGSTWTKKFPSLINKKISLLHLDNFDWIWNPYNVDAFIQEQIEEYKKNYDLIMNNQRCQLEHFEQVFDLTSWFAHDCLVVMDDTFLDRGVWSGKCGPVITYLNLQGFRVVVTNGGGTILARGYDQIPELQTDHLLICIE